MTKPRLNFTVENSTDRSQSSMRVSASQFPRFKVESLGPRDLDAVASDLLDVAASVFFIERNLPGKQHVNRAVNIIADIGLRAPSVWSPKAIAALQELLLFMGWTHWEFHFSKLERYEMPLVLSRETGELEKVSLFSGGLDSLCGAATERNNDCNRLVSYYSKQKELQRDLASGLGMIAPVQWSAPRPRSFSGRRTNYLYRSFMFLSLAAVTARSYGASKIQQFENGILASGIPPSLSDRSTKHAHYHVHRLCEIIFSEVLSGDWQISNPFELTTKRETFNAMVKRIGKNQANNLAKRAQSCWHLNAGFKLNEHTKKNGLPCGFCVPCIVRQTAHPLKTWRDLRSDAARNDPIHGRNFREFYAMLCDVQMADKSLHDFYLALGSQAQDAIRPRGAYQLAELKDLFSRFADEFMSTFEIEN